MKEKSDKTVLVLLAPGFEEADVVTITRTLRRAGIAVALVGLTAGPIRGNYGLALASDRTLNEIELDVPAAVVLPGGTSSATHMAGDPRVHALLRRVVEAGAYVFALPPTFSVLKTAGILPAIKPSLLPADQVLVDGRLVLVPPGFPPQISANTLLGLLGYTIRHRI
jgi:putative intracellular protease/amidase